MSVDDAAAEPGVAPASLLRRLGAALYDTLLLIALLMVVTLLLLPLTGGEAVTVRDFGWWAYGYRVLLLVLVIGFFGLFWTLQGQTLGMLAWRLRLERRDSGMLLTWSDTLQRLAAACLSWGVVGLGMLWILIDRDKLAWHDRLTATRVVVLPKKQR